MDNEKDILLIDDLSDVPVVQVKTAIILSDGRQGFLYPSGTIKDKHGKFLVSNQPGAKGAFDRDSARAANKKRDALRSEAIQAAIIQGAGASDLAGGIGRLASELVKIVLNGKQDRDKIQAFKELMRYGGLAFDLTRAGQVENSGQGGQVLSDSAIKALNFLLPAIEKRAKGLENGQD